MDREENRELEITLFEKGIHSLNRGLEAFEKYEGTEDKFDLKESVLFLNNGVELLMKEVLVKKVSEYLIYKDIDKFASKFIEAKKAKKTVFTIDNPVQTADYSVILDRVVAFVDKPLLKKNANPNNKSKNELFDFLSDLRNIRNQIEHYGIKKERKPMTCTRKIIPSGRRESTKMKIGDSSNEKDFYGRADRWDSAWI